MTQPRSNVASKLMVSVLSVVLVLAVAELSYRFRATSKRQERLQGLDPRDLGTRRASPPLYYELRPNYGGVTNSAGFPDSSRWTDKPPGRYRIAVVGDSVSMQGARPELLYVSRLQRKFDDLQLRPGIEVLNFGVTGYNTEQEAELLERRVLDFDPDLVVWQFHDNDGQHSIHSSALGAYYHRPASYLAHHLAGKILHYRCKFRVRKRTNGPVTSDQRNLICRWDVILASFERTSARLSSLDIALFVFLYPTWPEAGDWRNYGQLGRELHRELGERLTSLGATVMDLQPVFELLDPAEYGASDSDPWHPNAAGHELIADTIFEPLKNLAFASPGFPRSAQGVAPR